MDEKKLKEFLYKWCSPDDENATMNFMNELDEVFLNGRR